MRRLGWPVLALLLMLSPLGENGQATTYRTAKVVVVKSGVVPTAPGYAEYGLVLRNRSATKDALDVSVEVEAVDAGGESLAESYATVTLIPAATSFVITGALIWRAPRDIADVETDVRVGQTLRKGRGLPRVKHVSVTTDGDIVGSLTNPYRKPLPESATIYGVFLDNEGRIVAAGGDFADEVVRPGATVRFNVSTTARRPAVTSAKVSVDPCGYLAFTRDCPVAAR